MKKAINIRLDEELIFDLDNYAKELERTRTYIIEKAVTKYFDVLDEMISDKRIDEVKSGNVEVFSLEQVASKYLVTAFSIIYVLVLSNSFA